MDHGIKKLFNFGGAEAGLAGKIKKLLQKNSITDEEFLDNLEETLLCSDIGVHPTQKLLASVQGCANNDEVLSSLKNEMKKILRTDSTDELSIAGDDLKIIVFVGVNGAGKTTALAKLAHRYIQEGKKVYIAAGDTFRAAAVQQLELLAEKVGAHVISQEPGADPSAVVYDAIASAKANDANILLVDTAGRLHSNSNLMRELEKIIRTIKKYDNAAPHQTFLVLDATCGQNALAQATFFHQVADISGVIINKMDGSARGGVVLSIKEDHNLPICYIGTGENISDFEEFDPDLFVDKIFS